MTTLPPAADPSTLYVVDLTGYVFRAYYALPPMKTAAGEPTHAVFGVTQMLRALVQSRRPALLAVALDAPGPTFRKQLYPEYKATRRAHPEDLDPQIDRVHEVVAAYGIPVFVQEGFEADDLIATLVARARAARLDVVVVSADKDLLQLVGDGVIMYDTMREKVYGPKETFTKMGVRPDQIVDYLSLTGDSSDNVPGVPSVGPKTAAKLLAEFETLDGIYAQLGEVTRKGTRAKLEEHRDKAYLSRRLVSLRLDAPVQFDVEALRYGGAEPSRLRELFTRMEFHRLLEELGPETEGGLGPAPREPAPAEVSYRAALTSAAFEGAMAGARAAGKAGIYTLTERGPLHDAVISGVALSWEPGVAVYAPLDAGPAELSRELILAGFGGLFRDPGVRVFTAELKRELLLWARLGHNLDDDLHSSVSFDAELASYLIDPERHDHSPESVSQAELGRPLDARASLAQEEGARQLSVFDEVPVDRASKFACARADLALTVEPRLTSRLDGQGLHSLLLDIELPLARVLSDMERAGIRVDTERLARASEAHAARLAELEASAYEAAGREFKIGSPRALEAILFDELGLPVVKRTKTARSTDHEVLEQLSSQHALPALVLEHRALSKLKSTYLDALPRAVRPQSGRVHTTFNQAVTATGRISSSGPNLQNIPIRTPEGREIRAAFVPAEGCVLLSADYSQIELRVLAHLSEDPELLDAFRRGDDVHVRTARALFGADAPTREMRDAAKTVNYAVIYGQTKFALARNLGVTRDEAQRYIDTFFERYAGVAAFMGRTVEQARAGGGVRTLMGRWRPLPDINSRDRGLRAATERVARNTPIQGSAADLLKLAMVNLDAALRAQGLRALLLLTVHDELVLEVPLAERAQVAELVRDKMENVTQLAVPLAVTMGSGPDWNAAH